MLNRFRNLWRGKADVLHDDPVRLEDETPLALYFTPRGEIRPITAKSFRGGFIEGMSTSISPEALLTYSEHGYAFASIINVWVGRCLDIRADSINRLEWYVEDKKTHERIEGHPLTRAMERSGEAIIWRIMRSLDLYGEIYIKPLTNDYDYFSDVQWLNNLTTEPIITADGIERVTYSPTYGGKSWVFDIDEIAYWHTFNPFNDIRGQSLLTSALEDAVIDEQISSAVKAHYKNDARPGLMLMMDYDMNDNRSQEFIAWWKANYQGTKNANKVALLPKVIKDVKTLERSAVADDEKSTMNARRKICARFGVPLSIAGAWDDAQYQSSPEQRKSLYEETIIPAAEKIAKDATVRLLPFFGNPERERVWFDAKPILALMEDVLQKTTSLTTQLTAGGITVNQYREKLGDEPLPNGNVLYVPSGVVVTPVDRLGSMPAPEPAGGGFGFGGRTEVIPPADAIEEEPLKDAPGMALILSLSDNVDLIQQQKTLKQRLAGQPIRWLDPAEFHLTLLTAPAADEESLALLQSALADYPLPDLKLNIGSLAAFDRLGQHALHFRLRANPSLAELKEYQEALYLACESAGLKMPATSAPGAWIPHVTMGYGAQTIRRQPYQTNLAVQPDELRLSIEEGDGYKILYRSAAPGQPAAEETPAPPEPVTPEAKAALYIQSEVNYRPAVDERACAHCRWFSKEPLTTRCYLVVSDYPAVIDEAGVCDVFTPFPAQYSVAGYQGDYTTDGPNNDFDPGTIAGVEVIVEQSEELHNALYELAKELSVSPEALVEVNQLEKFVLNRAGKSNDHLPFESIHLSWNQVSLLTGAAQKLKTKREIRSLFAGLREAVTKAAADDEEEPAVTPEQADEWWHDYDRLMQDIGAVWLTDYMRRVWQTLEPKLGEKLKPETVEKLLTDFHPEITEAWTGTAEQPGVIARLFFAGMGAGQQALERKRTNMNPAKSDANVTKAAVEVDWTLVPEDAIASVEKYVGKLIRGIDSTTLADVRKIITEWLESGKPVSALAEALKPIFDDPVRAELIAATEASHAYNAGAIQRWDDAGVKKMKFQTVRDGHVCPQCEALNGKVGTLADGWNGVFIPVHPGCRCYARPVL